MLEVIINKLQSSKFQSLVATLLIYDLPLICLIFKLNVVKYLLMFIIQIIMIYLCMRWFDDCNETNRSKYLRIQFLISCVGILVAYLIGKNIRFTISDGLITIMTSIFLSYPAMFGITSALFYAAINMILCGSGVVFGVLIEMAKENEYL